MKTLCIYHANCSDGFAAAWSVRHFLGKDNVDFFPANYGDTPPDVTGRRVVIVDFSYPRETLLEMAKTAETILVLDHHKTALEQLVNIEQDAAEGDYCPIVVQFDMKRSGARLAWDHFSCEMLNPPGVLRAIEDRDLWRFSLPNTKEICAAVYSYDMKFDLWDELMLRWPVNELIIEGRGLLRDHDKKVTQVIESSMRLMLIGGYVVPVVNCPHFMVSDVGNRLAFAGSFAACYTDTPAHRQFSLRSTDAGVDVSEIAKQYGGGGHRNAAGFKVLRHESMAKI